MSQRHLVQDASGVIAGDENGDILIVAENSAPPSSTAGYAKGCLFIDSLNAKLYVNSGTSASCTFAEAT
tara:strand:+ start:7300 stop:7506 length:207 start_codon:yes stop_codon:yes gene_type:complete